MKRLDVPPKRISILSHGMSDLTRRAPELAGDLAVADLCVIDDGAAVILGGRRLPARWLASILPANFNPRNSQRVTGAIPSTLTTIASADSTEHGLALVFKPGSAAPVSVLPELLPWAALASAIAAPSRGLREEWISAVVPWPAVAPSPPVFEYADLVKTRAGAAAARSALASHGLFRVVGVPEPSGKSDEGTTSGGVLALAAALGTVFETNYGRSFEVRVEAAPLNGAYTAGPLAPHVDNPYREPMPAFQVLVCRVAAESGGETTFADGAALAAADPAAAAVLARVPVAWGWTAVGVHALRASRPVLELHAGRLAAVHWNELAQRCPAPEDADAWFAAADAWKTLLASGVHATELRLTPGEGVVWDNRRLLHGRRAYVPAATAARQDQSPAAGEPAAVDFGNGGVGRWLSGVYLTEDSVVGAWAAERGIGAW